MLWPGEQPGLTKVDIIKAWLKGVLVASPFLLAAVLYRCG